MKAGGGQMMKIGVMLRQWLVKLEWFSTLFPRIPVPIQQRINSHLQERFPPIPQHVPLVPSQDRKEWPDREVREREGKRDWGRERERDRAWDRDREYERDREREWDRAGDRKERDRIRERSPHRERHHHSSRDATRDRDHRSSSRYKQEREKYRK